MNVIPAFVQIRSVSWREKRFKIGGRFPALSNDLIRIVQPNGNAWPYSGEDPRAIERFARTQYARDTDSDDRILLVVAPMIAACPWPLSPMSPSVRRG